MNERFKFVLLALAAIIWCSILSAAPISAQSTLSPDIASLETRFFDHTYPQESMDARLTRLERMVFGEAKTGSDQARLTALLLAVPADSNNPSSATSGSAVNPSNAGTTLADASSSGAYAPGTQTTGNVNASQPSVASTPPVNQPDNTGGDGTESTDYPRITQLEQEILGKTFTNEPIQNRLEQLELKAFGKASNADLFDRTEALEDYADKHFPHQQNNYDQTAGNYYPDQNTANAQTASPGYGNANLAPPNASLDQKVSWLEKQIFGTIYANQPLLDRVNRLANNIYPANSPQRSQSLADQVSSMIGAVELNPRQPSPSIAQAPQYNGYQNSIPPFSQNSFSQSSQYPDQSQLPQQTQQTPQKNHGHSFMQGLAHVLGTVGSMAAGQLAGGMMMGGMNGMGGGYGMPFGL